MLTQNISTVILDDDNEFVRYNSVSESEGPPAGLALEPIEQHEQGGYGGVEGEGDIRVEEGEHGG
jgi:uncharacterized protein YggL (DUF469 family)